MSAGFDVRITADAAAFLDRAGAWLAGDPVTSTVLTTISARAKEEAARGEDPSTGLPHWWFATVHGRSGEVVGAAMRTAPFVPYPPYLLAMPEAAAEALADVLVDRGEEVLGANGLRPAADVFAARVVARTGGTVAVTLHTRLFELTELVRPPAAPGRLRLVRPAEAELALDWLTRFFGDADEQAGRRPGEGHAEHASMGDVQRKLREQGLWFWVDGDDVPVSMVGATPPAYGVTRIAPVFTPKDLRGHGYASNAVAEVSQLLLDRGARVTLFTDQANPTSNRIYQALGYRPVVDTVDLRIS
ncbi:MAG TPA: GNAT family N-acetyltransferase [Nocardioides sp.]|nr:GNAT family N-acetyltransferase [Nocardioides sp.]